MAECEFRGKFLLGLRETGEVSEISFILTKGQGFVLSPQPLCAILLKGRRSAESACLLPALPPTKKCPIAEFAYGSMTLQEAAQELRGLGIFKL